MAYFVLCAVTLVACLLLGGGTRGGFLSDATLQLLCIPLLLAALWRLRGPVTSRMRWAMAFCLALVLLPFLQLLPLPPSVWTALPGREAEAAPLALLGRDLPWMPISVSPTATWLSLLSLLPPIAIFLGTIVFGLRERRLLSLVVLVVGVFSVFVGLLQIAQGPSSVLRPFDYTNDTEAVGFFANRNHFAALLYSLTLLAAAWAVANAQYEGERDQSGYKVVAIVAGFTVLVVLVAAQAMARSRAGLGLTMVALFGAFALGFVGGPQRTTARAATKLLGAAIALALVFGVQFALYRVLERFAVDPLQDGRVAFARVTSEAAKAFIPTGSGVGTFVPVYAGFEKPNDTMIDTYANRAHNDFLEGFLESGFVGAVLLALFLGWLALRSVQLWRRMDPTVEPIDQLLARAATIVIGLLIAHSLADYPLRTGVMMAVMAFACAVLIGPAGLPERQLAVRRESERETIRSWVPEGVEPAVAFPSSQPTSAAQISAATPKLRERWGRDVDWPAEWRKPGKQNSRPAGSDKKRT